MTTLEVCKPGAGWLVMLAVLAGCGGSDPPPSSPAMQEGRAASHAQGLATPGPAFPQSLDGLQPNQPVSTAAQRAAQALDSGYSINTQDREAVRLFYNSVFASSSNVANGWTGNLANCNAGDTSADYKAAVLRRINWFRAMAGVPGTVQLDAGFNAKAQQAAMLMSANNSLSHFPPSTWTCYNATAAEAAGKSNLGLGHAGADAVTEGYMRDPGANNNVVGHRRWVLYPQTQFMGTGDVGNSATGARFANALWIQDANIFSARPAVRDDFVAWPAKGYVPYTMVFPRWSISYPAADFSSAQVSMTQSGTPITIQLEPVTNGFGENTLVWTTNANPDGSNWAKPGADTTYQVTVSNVRVNGAARSFSYSVIVFDPDQPAAASSGTLTLSGSASAMLGQAQPYTFSAAAGATDYQWRSISTTPFTLNDGAETGSANFTASTSSGYAVLTQDAAASGTSAYHLAHTQVQDQALQLKATLVGSASASLSFASRLGLSSPVQTAKVEISLDEGGHWTTLYQQAGQQGGNTSGFGESSFSSKQVSLAAYADKSFLLRFRYELGSGSFYPQATAGIGWYIDDIRLSGVEAVSTTGTATRVTSTGFSFVPTQAGTSLLQVRAGMYGYYADWGALKRITVTAANPQDCFFNWAEKTFPTLFSPATASVTVAPYYVRYYSGTNAYLGFNTADGHLYYLGAPGLVDLGASAGWLATASCQ